MVDHKVFPDLREEEIYSIRNFWSWMNFFVVLFCVLLCFSIIRTNLFMCVQVSGSSMSPTVYNGDYLLVTKNVNVERGDVVVFYSDRLDKLLIKRVIGLPGDTVRTYNGDVYVKKSGDTDYTKINDDNAKYPHSTWKTSYSTGTDLDPVTVDDGKIFVLGDNRTDSLDSRILGAVPLKDVRGVVYDFVIDSRYVLQFLYRYF